MESLTELFSSGGPVMFFIAGISFVAWFLSLRSWALAGALLKKSQEISVPLLQAPSQTCNGARSTRSRSDSSEGPEDHEFVCFGIESRTSRLRGTLWLIGTLASVLLLLGLLGTVVGMLISFEVIQAHGTSRPRLLAGGIGQALMTTQAGLWTALPVLFFHHIISSRIRLIGNEMEVLSHIMQTYPAGGHAGRARKASSEPLPDDADYRGVH